MLKIYNTLTRNKETFRPIVPGQVKMYVCGMTVYDYCHIGHARVMVVFDTVARYFKYRGYALTYVRNVTDIDDKIIKRAQACGEDIGQLTERFIDAMHEDERALSVEAPDVEPRATRSMGEIIAMIRALLDRGHAYVGSNGDVFYSVSSFDAYGRLSGKNLEELRAGERVDIDRAKRDPLDFVLWKMSKPGEPAWESPWGPGRPGWHIECSAMSTACLGHHFDIHGGGMDLQFPHHENEIAQSEGATGEKFVNLWMHNGFVRVNEEKMSKSLGNFFTVREVLEVYRPEVLRFFILSSHYRSPLNYSDEQLDDAGAGLTRLYTALRGLSPEPETDAGTEFRRRFDEAMDDDFNSPVAIAVLFDLAREINRQKPVDAVHAARLGATLRSLGSLLGLLQQEPEEALQQGFRVAAASFGIKGSSSAHFVSGAETGAHFVSDAEIDAKVEARLEAKKRKDWAAADRIRDELKAAGVVVEDVPGGGSLWRRG